MNRLMKILENEEGRQHKEFGYGELFEIVNFILYFIFYITSLLVWPALYLYKADNIINIVKIDILLWIIVAVVNIIVIKKCIPTYRTAWGSKIERLTQDMKLFSCLLTAVAIFSERINVYLCGCIYIAWILISFVILWNDAKGYNVQNRIKVRKDRKAFGKIVCSSLYAFYCCLMILVSTIGLIVYNLAKWVMDTWGLLSIDEIIFHLKVPLEGTNTEMVKDGINACVPLALLVGLFLIAMVVGMRKKRCMASVSILLITVFSVGSGVKAVYNLYSELGVKDYVKSQKTESHFIQENYVDPRITQITFPEKKRNLIYIFLESMESTYTSRECGGAYDVNFIPELTQIAQSNVNFSNTDKVGGAYPAYGSGWTMSALFAQTSGLPIKNSVGSEDMNQTLGEQTTFSSSACNLEDILGQEGYNQCFMIGSDATFGGRRAYFNSHGECEIWDYNTAKELGYIQPDYYVWWGYEDSKLFTYAQEKLLDLSARPEPFNLTLLTVDTHFEDGYVCELCQNEYGENQYGNVLACSSRQIAEFVKWIQQQPFYENTTIVLCGDHLTMDSDFCVGLDDYERGVYNAFINLPEGLDTSYEKTHYREFTTMDMFPTTLAALGADIKGDHLALGVNLFSDEQTLAEQYGREGLNEELMKKSKFYDLLINDIDAGAE